MTLHDVAALAIPVALLAQTFALHYATKALRTLAESNRELSKRLWLQERALQALLEGRESPGAEDEQPTRQ